MVATVAWNGFGRVTTADTTTGWGVVKITAGGGTPAISLADGQIEGAGALTITSNAKRVVLYYDIGAGNELDFSPGGAEEGQMVYAWAQFLAAGLLQTRNVGGFGVFADSNAPAAGQYNLYYHYGADNYSGGWKRLVQDPTATPSASAGTPMDLSAVRYIGVWADTTGTARFDNLICDAIDVGTGLTVTGTSTVGALISDLLADEAANLYGVVTALNDSESAVELAGSLVLGDTAAVTNSTLSDVDSKIFLAEPLYYDGTSVVNSVPVDYFAITCVGGTGVNSVEIGKLVGADGGRNGCSIVGNVTYDLSIAFDDGNVDTANWYGASFESTTGPITWGTNTAHKMFSCSLTGCAQFDPIGGVQVKGLAIVGTRATSGGLLWNESIDVVDSGFIANTIGAAVEHPLSVGSPYGHSGLTYSGNTFDVNNTSGAGISVAKLSGSNPSTYTGTLVTFTASFTLTLTDVPEGVAVTIVNSATRAELQSSLAPVSGIVTYGHSGGETVDIMFMDVAYDPNVSDIYDITLDNADQSIKIGMLDDIFYENPA